MPVVPFTQRLEPEIPDWAMPSETHMAMAAAAVAERFTQTLIEPRIVDEDRPAMHQGQRDLIEALRNIGDMNITPGKPELTPTEAETIPGRRIVQHKEPWAKEIPMANDSEKIDWEMLIKPRPGDTKEQFLKRVPEHYEVFRFHPDSELYMLRRIKKQEPKPEDLVS